MRCRARREASILVAVVALTGAGSGCNPPCTAFDPETHVLDPAVDAGIPEAGTRPPVEDCRRLCGDVDDPTDTQSPHPTSCQILTGDAGQPLVACDESGYEVCVPIR